MAKIIVIAGLIRSGSVWQYNAVRLALVSAGRSVYGGVAWPEYDPRGPVARNAEYHLIKEHRYFTELATQAYQVFTSFRDLMQVRRSWRRFSGMPLTDADLSMHVEALVRWQMHADHYTPFRNILRKPKVELARLCTVLGLPDLDLDNLLAELHALKPPENGQDPTTLLFYNHVSLIAQES